MQSTEKLVRGALRRACLWRTLATICLLPGHVAHLISALFEGVYYFFEALTKPLFMQEVEAVREYEALSGVRLGNAIGEPTRYTDLHRPEDDPLSPRTYAPDAADAQRRIDSAV